MAGTAEQQAPVRREPVVIQADFLVAQRQVVRDQLRGSVRRQGLGGDDVAAGREHLAAELRFEFFQVRVAGQHQTAGAHRATGTTHLHGAAMDQLQHRALLEDLHAKGLRELALRQGPGSADAGAPSPCPPSPPAYTPEFTTCSRICPASTRRVSWA